MIDVKDCYLCGKDETETLLSGSVPDSYYQLVDPSTETIPMHWIHCKPCDFTFRMERMDSDELDKLYTNYRDIMLRKESPDEYFDRITGYPDDESENFRRAMAFKEILEKQNNFKSKTHLDIGTGAGVFLHTFKRLNPDWTSFAVEATPIFAETAKKRLGIEVYNGFYKSGLFGHKFDLITILQVLEHIYDPKETLRYIREDLTEEGILIIEVPSSKNISVLPKEHDMFSVPHFCLYSTESLSNLVQQEGFEVLEAKEFRLHKRETYQVRLVARVKRDK